MRAAFDGTVVRPPAAGVQIAVQHELQALVRALGDVSGQHFFCADPGLADILRARGAAPEPLPRGLHHVAWRILWQQLVLPRRLQRLGCEVLHALAYTAPARCPVPYVLNVHDVIALEHPELCARANRLHMRLLLPRSARRAAACIVSTHYVAARLQAVLGVPPERVHVAPLGVDVERFAASAGPPAHPDLPHPRPYILFVGNLEPKKGLSTLLDAYAASRVVDQVDLLLAGRAAWRCQALVRRVVSWRGPGRVHWLQRVAGADLPGLMQGATVLVMPSLEEGFGMPVLEAMAAGTAVLHSDHPALVEAAGGAGTAFRRGEAEDLARHLGGLCRDPARRAERVAAGRARAARASWQAWGETALAIVRQVAAGGPGRPEP